MVKSISILSHELKNHEITCDKLEIVLAVKIRHGYDGEDGFNQFVSAFSCLAIPFSQPDARDYVCMMLNFSGLPSGLLLDSDQKIVQDDISFLTDVGAIAYPFTDEQIDLFTDPIKSLNLPLNLEQLLTCCSLIEPPNSLRKSDNSEEINLSVLNNRRVGMYLCYDGFDILRLNQVYRQCRDQKLEFEIVVVYMQATLRDPQELYEELDNWNISWWVAPFNNSVSRWLHHLFGCSIDDKLIIVEGRGTFLDPYGADVVNNFGIVAYPFTRNTLVDIHERKLGMLAFEEFFEEKFVRCGNRKVSVARFSPRNVIGYLSWSCKYHSLYDKVSRWYRQMKDNNLDFEVVFFYAALDGEVSAKLHNFICSMPWFVQIWSPMHANQMKKRMFLKYFSPYDEEMLIGFGNDGEILTMQADVDQLSHRGAALRDVLRKDLIDLLTRFFRNLHRDEVMQSDVWWSND